MSSEVSPKVPTSGVGRLLRAILVNDEQAVHDLKEHLYEDGGLAGVALGVVARRRFSSAQDVRDITRFLTDINAARPDDAGINRREAEAYIRVMLGERGLDPDIPPEVLADMTGLLLDEIIRDLGLSPSAIDELIVDAEDQYSAYLAAADPAGPGADAVGQHR